jgi:hypothetical protein
MGHKQVTCGSAAQEKVLTGATMTDTPDARKDPAVPTELPF